MVEHSAYIRQVVGSSPTGPTKFKIMNTFLVKTIENMTIAYVAKTGNPATVAGKAFWELERKVPLKGNKFYGIYNESKNEYWACVAINQENQDAIKDLAHGEIAGGVYACATLSGNYNSLLREIAPTFNALIKEYTRDTTRLPVEFYKRHTEIIVMLPITD